MRVKPTILLQSASISLLLSLAACSHRLSNSEAQSLLSQALPSGKSRVNLTLPATPDLTTAVRALINSGDLKQVGGLQSFAAAYQAYFGQGPQDSHSGTVEYNSFYNQYNVTCPLYRQRLVVVSVLNDTDNDVAVVQVRHSYEPMQPFYQKLIVEGKASVAPPSSSMTTTQVTFRHFNEGWRIVSGL